MGPCRLFDLLRGELDFTGLTVEECSLDLCLAYAINNSLGVFPLRFVGDFLDFVNNWKNHGKTRFLQDFLLKRGIAFVDGEETT